MPCRGRPCRASEIGLSWTVPSVTLGELVFDYADDGPREAPVVLMLHGFPQDHTSWDVLSADLVAAGYRTIRPDQRGYSAGARPTGAQAYRLKAVVTDAFDLLDALGVERAHVVGHDWGGATAWGMASLHPERLLTLTVLSTPHPAALSRAMLRSSQGLNSWYMGLFQIPGLAERALAPGGRFWREMLRGVPPEAEQRYAANARRPGALSAMLGWYRAMPLDIARPSIEWHRISVPTLYVWGNDDPALGAAAARGSSRFVASDFAFVELMGQGHWLPERASDLVLPLVLDRLG